MDVRQLGYFLEVARHGSFTRAAEALHVAQPAVSMAIRKLEEELDLVLFNRQDRKVTLTAEGEVFIEHARRVLADLKAAGEEMADLRGLGKGEVRIGIPPMSAYFFPDIIRDFKERYPNLSLSVYGEGGWRIQKMIVQWELDMGIIAGRNVPETLDTRLFVREEVVICVPPGHPFADRSGVPFAEFIREPLLFFKEGYYLRELLLEMLKDAGEEPRIVFETNLFSLVKPLIRNGLGISTFLRVVLEGDDELVAVPFDPPLSIELFIAWKKRSHLSRANRAFVDFLLERTRGYGRA
ncbi:MAG TPA: LysR family transcriptional regulator [Desulfuromonadaceae bacterium]